MSRLARKPFSGERVVVYPPVAQPSQHDDIQGNPSRLIFAEYLAAGRRPGSSSKKSSIAIRNKDKRFFIASGNGRSRHAYYHPRLCDFFFGRRNDLRWVYSFFHFWNERATLRQQQSKPLKAWARLRNDTKAAIAPCSAEWVDAIEGTSRQGHAPARAEIAEGKTTGPAKSRSRGSVAENC